MGVSALVRRILVRLERAEAREPNPHFQDDYRIAWITVLRAARGEPQPQVSATYTVLGVYPDKVFSRLTDRRKALLGREYELFYAEPSSPKKPVESVRLEDLQPRKRWEG